MDFFEKIFEIQPQKRITIGQILTHGLMTDEEEKMTPESPNTTATEEDEETLLQWECSRVQFVEKIVETVVGYNFLSSWLTSAFKFYISKVLLYFLNRPEIKVLREG